MSILINAYSTVTNPPAIHFQCNHLHQRGLADPEFIDHLDGFIGFVLSAGDEQMNARRYALWRHIQKVKHQFSFEIEEENFSELAIWAQNANVIMFMPDGTIRNPAGEVLQYPNGEFDINVDMPYPSEALQRKANTEQYLKTLGLQTPKSLPPVVAESEVILRNPQEVAERALALMLIGIQAESFRNNKRIDPQTFKQRCPLGFAALSNNELAFMNSKQPAEQEIIQMSWRYEALLPLQWALNWQSELAFADAICDVTSLVQKGMDYSKQGISSVTLRPVKELLDAMDLHYRLHWIGREFDRQHQQAPAAIITGIVQERHYAFNWLTNFENADWDNVDTPT